MARIDNLTNFVTDVAAAIKNKKGTTAQIPCANFDTEIASIETGGSPFPSASDITINYTGDMTTRDIVDAYGRQYKLLELTSSGTLTLSENVEADLCAVGGGLSGGSASDGNGSGASGCGGRGGEVTNTKAIFNLINVTVGAVGGNTFIKDGFDNKYLLRGNGNAGSGGGNGWFNNSFVTTGGTPGNNFSGYAFNDTSAYTFPFGSGGGGGGFYCSDSYSKTGNGGDGGENGSSFIQGTQSGSAGGVAGIGAGNGGSASSGNQNGQSAVNYGCGGGGGAYYYYSYLSTTTTFQGTGGLGKQGVVFIRIPY